MYYVYILRLSNNLSYVGSTPNLQRRVQEHKTGKNSATKHYLPCKLISYICFEERITALRFERYLKTGSGRAFRKKHFGI